MQLEAAGVRCETDMRTNYTPGGWVGEATGVVESMCSSSHTRTVQQLAWHQSDSRHRPLCETEQAAGNTH